MPTNTAIFSGPGGFRRQAVSALESAGFSVGSEEHNLGLPDTAAGKVDPTAAFIAVHHEEDLDIDQALGTISGLGWVLRAHFGAPLITAPLIADQEAEAEKRILGLVNRRLSELGIVV